MKGLYEEILRKMEYRKFAQDNMGAEDVAVLEPTVNDPDARLVGLYTEMEANLVDAEDTKQLSLYFILFQKKGFVGSIFLFIKKCMRKAVMLCFGWLISPLLNKQSGFNGRLLNTVSRLREILFLLHADLAEQKNEQTRLSVRQQETGAALENLTDSLRSLSARFNTSREDILRMYTSNTQEHEELRESIRELFSYSREISINTDEFRASTNREIDEIRTSASREFDEIRTSTNREIDEIRTSASREFDEIRTSASREFDEIRTSANREFDEIRTSANREFEEIRAFITPETRDGVNYKDAFLSSSMRHAELDAQLLLLQRSSTSADVAEAKRLFRESVLKDLREVRSVKKQRRIAIVCRRFRMEHGVEAIKNEAFDLFQLINQKSVYRAQLISMEDQSEGEDFEQPVIYVDECAFPDCIREINPSLIIYCESTPFGVYELSNLYAKYRSVIRLSSQNPIKGHTESVLSELRHCNDYGLHHYMVESEYAYDRMVAEGFKNVYLTYPVVDISRLSINTKLTNGGKEFTIGFATSPMAEGQIYDRGVDLLGAMIAAMPDCRFTVLWRNSEVTLPDSVGQASNCHVHFGKYDMSVFYEEIDCLVVPYKTFDNNHACSLSALEAMLNRIPVVCTNVCGVASVVEKCGIGLVSGTSGNQLASAVETIRQNYLHYSDPNKASVLSHILRSQQVIPLLEGILSGYAPENLPSLAEWNYALEQKGKYLVRGHEAIKAYYQSLEVAGSYHEDRFANYPMSCFDAFERESIQIILEDKFGNSSLDLLDIASGSGRIVQELIRHGCCLSLDSSQAMIDLVAEKYHSSIETMLCDYFTDSLKRRFNVITVFRYLRHFDYTARKKLYCKMASNLATGGIILFDVPNIKVEMALREAVGWEHFNIYDVFWTKESIAKEMRDNGFKIEYMISVGAGLLPQLPESLQVEPITWTLGVSKST